MTTIRAEVDKKFIRRFLFVAIGCFFLMLWGLYDAVVTMPREKARALAYEELTVQQEAGGLTEAERAEKWDALTEEKGWSSTLPDSSEHVDGDIYFQWFLFGLGLVLGVFFLLKYLKLLSSWIEADESGVQTSWGESLKFEGIQSIKKHKWNKKGIAKVEYSDEAGVSKTMVFDDFKYQREDMGTIMKMAEENLSDDQIIGDVRETSKVKPPSSSSSAIEQASEEESEA